IVQLKQPRPFSKIEMARRNQAGHLSSRSTSNWSMLIPCALSDAAIRIQATSAALLRSELAQRGITYKMLAERLNERRPGAETETTIKLKMSRGSFQAAFLFECLDAIGAETVMVPVRTLLQEGR
ncbi:DUF6471 domain-containing protein, partial [Burkholderia pseudomallei]